MHLDASLQQPESVLTSGQSPARANEINTICAPVLHGPALGIQVNVQCAEKLTGENIAISTTSSCWLLLGKLTQHQRSVSKVPSVVSPEQSTDDIPLSMIYGQKSAQISNDKILRSLINCNYCRQYYCRHTTDFFV